MSSRRSVCLWVVASSLVARWACAGAPSDLAWAELWQGDGGMSQAPQACSTVPIPGISAADRDPGEFGGAAGAQRLAALGGMCRLLWAEGATAPEPVADRYRACLMAQLPGSAMQVMELYANGWGVRRDLAVAAQLACWGPRAEAEYEFLSAELSERRDHAGAAKGPLRWCDFVTSGANASACAVESAAVERQHRQRALDRLAQAWPPAVRRLYADWRKQVGRYAQMVGEHEVDRSGTAAGMFVAGAVDAVEHAAAQWAMAVAGLRELPSRPAPSSSRPAPLSSRPDQLSGAQVLAAARARLAKACKHVQDPQLWQDELLGGPDLRGVTRTHRQWQRTVTAAMLWARQVAPRADWPALETEWVEQRIVSLHQVLPLCDRIYSPRDPLPDVCKDSPP